MVKKTTSSHTGGDAQSIEAAPDTALLPLPAARCLNSEQAAAYLAIGVTLLTTLDVPFVKLGRRRV